MINSLLGFNLISTNPMTFDFSPPIGRFLLEPSAEDAIFQASQLLRSHFRRHDPPVLRFPVPSILPAIYLSRYPVWRNYILRMIKVKAQRKK